MIDTLKKAFDMLPPKMNTYDAAVNVLAICFQESDMTNRRQIGGGPGRGLAQFEKGNAKSRAGVYGVMTHDKVGTIAADVAKRLGIEPTIDAVYNALEKNDVLAFALARLLLWTSPDKLPQNSVDGWRVYEKTWRPGAPRPEKWAQSWRLALAMADGQ